MSHPPHWTEFKKTTVAALSFSDLNFHFRVEAKDVYFLQEWATRFAFYVHSISYRFHLKKKLVPKKEVLNPLHPHDLTYPIDLPVNFFFFYWLHRKSTTVLKHRDSLANAVV